MPTMTIDQLIAQVRQSIADKLAQRRTHTDAITAVRDKMLSESRDATTDTEAAAVTAATTARDQIDAEIAELREKLSSYEQEKERDEAADRLSREVGPGAPVPGHEDRAHVGREERTYRPDNGSSFFRDFYAAQQLMNPDAQARLGRHVQEERTEAEKTGKTYRAIGTSNIGGLVVPAYLVEEFAPVLRNGRPLANAAQHKDLPAEGMTLIVPRGNTGSAAAPQANQNTQVQNTDIDFNNDLTVPVRTIAGEQDVARQILERGTPGMDTLIYSDLVSAYATELDRELIVTDGTAGTHKGLINASGTNSVTYTDATPTVPEIWSKLANVKGLVGSTRKQPMNLWAMTTMRWAWFVAALDSQNRPLLINDPAAAVNAMGNAAADSFGEGQLVGTLMGTPVLADDNIPTNLGAGTNQDDIFGVRRQDLYLWEEGDGMPRELRFDQTKGNQLSVVLVVYGYSGFTAERYPKAVGVLSGTGLIQPTF